MNLKSEPFFVLGNPRSGTSLLRIMLNCNQALVVPPECGFIFWWYKKYEKWFYSKSNVELFLKDFSESKKIETWHLDYGALSEFIDDNKPVDYAGLCACIYIFYGIKSGKEVKTWGDKNNYYVLHTAEIVQLFPKAKIIHLIRDGRDVACSYKEIETLNTHSKYKPVLSSDLSAIANEWVDNNLTISALGTTQEYFSIKYENLILQTEETLTKLCDFLSVPFDTNMLRYFDINKALQLEPNETMDWKMKTLQAPDPTNIGRYKNILSPEEIAIFNKVAIDVLKTYQYE